MARTKSLVVGTGSSGRKGSSLSYISGSAQKWNGKLVTVSGRLRSNTRYATNRNLHRLTDGQSTLLVVDDKPPIGSG